ncbi:MAG: RNA polymerase sigma factor [Planctomycetota bacterium]
MQPAASAASMHPVVDPPWVAAATRRLRRYLRCLRCPVDVVDDQVQEALLVAVREHGSVEPPWPWLLTVAKNGWLAQCRRRRPQLVAEIDALDAGARQELGDDGGDRRVDALRQCVRALPLRQRRALALCYGDGLARDDVAARLGLRPEGLKSLLGRVREVLRRCVRRRTSDA